jgi:hypothetical protein
MYDIIPQNGDCPRESIAHSFFFWEQSMLSKWTIIAELGMERLTFSGHSSYKRLALFCTEKKQDDRALCRKVLIESRKCFLEFHKNQQDELLCS